jgi:hypothetical protein
MLFAKAASKTAVDEQPTVPAIATTPSTPAATALNQIDLIQAEA